jgi:hypothetical protein
MDIKLVGYNNIVLKKTFVIFFVYKTNMSVVLTACPPTYKRRTFGHLLPIIIVNYLSCAAPVRAVNRCDSIVRYSNCDRQESLYRQMTCLWLKDFTLSFAPPPFPSVRSRHLPYSIRRILLMIS